MTACAVPLPRGNSARMTDGLTALKTHLPKAAWTDEPDIIAPHLVEWRDKYFGQTPLMLTPRTTDEVSQCVKICAQYGLKIVPQGGNTGLVGGQTPQGEILLSTQKMALIRDINPVSQTLIAEAGAILHAVQEAAQSVHRKFPLSLASEGSCTIGGTLSTNAGGVHVLQYGTMKDLVRGVEAVLPNGDIYNGLTSLRKDNTGYDLSRLFLGAEGTLGIITAASLKLFPQPGYVQRVMVGLESPAKAIALLNLSQGQNLAMFEVLPRIGLGAVIDNIPGQKDPFSTAYAWYGVIDWHADTAAEGHTQAEQVLSRALDSDIIHDAVIAQNDAQAARLLALREHMSAGQKFLGGSIKQDITVPIDKIPEFFKRAETRMQEIVPGCRPVGFGHFGDGNIHYNITQPERADNTAFLDQWEIISEAVFDMVDDLGGSISAEHGIGIMKRDTLSRRADPVKLALMRDIKTALDPHNIMNPRVLI